MTAAQLSALNLANYCAKRAKAHKAAGNAEGFQKMVAAVESWIQQAAR